MIPKNLEGLVTDWPFHPRYGVGVLMKREKSKLIYNDVRFLIELFGCPKAVSDKYALQLVEDGELLCTLHANVDFQGLKTCLKNRGVSMEIVPPKGMNF